MDGGADLRDPLYRRYTLAKQFHIDLSITKLSAVEIDEMLMVDSRVGQLLAERRRQANG